MRHIASKHGKFMKKIKSDIVNSICIFYRGEKFRTEYSHLHVIHSIIPETVRVMALTATATNTTRSFIIKSWSMQSPEVIYIPPIGNNVIYVVLEKPKCVGGYFKGIVDNLKTKQTNSGRKIVFCKTYRDVITIYQYFKRELQELFTVSPGSVYTLHP